MFSKDLFFRSRSLVLCLAYLVGALVFSACGSESGPKTLDADAVELPVSADGQNQTDRLPKMVFDKEIHDFGIIKAGEKVSYSFRFVNRGGRDLIIQSASGSCGCTVPDFPKEPIPPGREGFIRVMFNSEGKSGVQEKQVTVLANTLPNTITVRVKAEIVQP
ncbi:MAG: DUF1573 domain-containing protein [Cytophagia bacterium]|nr:DUF1573 domain-containing protein [Cytophagia bacterium]